MSAVTKERASTELVPASDMLAIARLDEVSRDANAQIAEAEVVGNQLAKALITARAIRKLRDLLDERVMMDIMELKGSALGFKTDEQGRKAGSYQVPQVRDVIIQALIRGLRVVGNEINIIGGNLYVTKEGFERLLRDLKGLSDLKIQIGVPQTSEKGALVPCHAEWLMHGFPDSIACEKDGESDYRIPVRVNEYMGIDAILGKAKSKLLRRIYERATGSQLLSEADGMDADVIETEVGDELQAASSGDTA